MAAAQRFDHQAVLVTGACSGIGRAIVARLASEGARVALSDLDAGTLAQVVRQLPDTATPLSLPADLSRPDERDGLVERVHAAFGRIDVLVNNAAVQGSRTALVDQDEAELARIMEVNLLATIALSTRAARVMTTAGRGAIVNVGAIQRRLPLPTFAAYAASKGGVTTLTRSLAVELGAHGIRVNTVAPGVIDTASLRSSPGGSDSSARRPAATVLGRRGTPAEVAAAVAFLASADASFVTGVELTVDGGRTLSRRPDTLAAAVEGSAE